MDPIQIIRDTVWRVEREWPGLRNRNLDAWTAIVAWEAHGLDPRIGRKAAGGGRPMSANTLGILPVLDVTGMISLLTIFDAYEIARDERDALSSAWLEAGNQNCIRFTDYGAVTGQQWIRPIPTPLDLSDPQPDDPPVPPTLPDLTIILARLDVLEATVERLLTAPVPVPYDPSDWPEPCDPSDWEAAGRIAWWGVTLPLRRKP